MSLATYYWPNPDTKDGLPYIKKDGHTNPEIGKITDKKLFSSMPNKVFALSLYYFYTDDEKYAEKAVKILRAWFTDKKTYMTPNLNFAQAIKGKNDGLSTGILDGRDLAKIPDSIFLLKRSSVYIDKVDSRIRKWLDLYLEWLLTSKNGVKESGSPNNHGSWYAVQAISLCIFLGKDDTAKKMIKKIMESRLSDQIDSEGKQKLELDRTKALFYSTFNLSALFTVAQYAKFYKIDMWNYKTKDGKGIKLALDYLIPFYSNEKDFSYDQIKAFDPEDFYPLIAKAFVAYEDNKYAELIKKSLKSEDLKKIRENLLYYGLNLFDN